MKARKEMVRTGTKMGAVLGAIAFFIFGIMPGIYFGSYGSLVVLRHLTGGSVDPTVLVRMVIAAGIMLGIACAASAAIVLGSVMGSMMAHIVEAFSPPSAAEAEEYLEEAVSVE